MAGVRALVFVGLLASAGGGCSHLVKIEASSKPIAIDLHVKIDQDVRVRLEGDLPPVRVEDARGGAAAGAADGAQPASPTQSDAQRAARQPRN